MPPKEHGGRPGRAVHVGVCVILLVSACGESEAPKPDREQVRDVLADFFHDAANGHVEGVCGALTGVGRAQAAGRGSITGRLPDPVSEQPCVEKKAQVATSSRTFPS